MSILPRENVKFMPKLCIFGIATSILLGIIIATLWWYRATQTLTTVPHINLSERD